MTGGKARTCLAIVNPAAGGGRCGKLATEALERLRHRGLEVDERRTGGPGDATLIAREAFESGQRDFIAVGGDGTGYEIVNGLLPAALERRERVSLGFMPLGTGNSFLRDFTDNGAQDAAEALCEWRSRPCDVIRLEHEAGVLHYINILSLGFVADVTSTANRRFKALGAAGYGFGVLGNLATLEARRIRMRLDGDRWWEQDATFVSVNNSRFTGGKMMMAPFADTADGVADVIVAARMTRAQLLAAFPKIFSGQHVHMPSVTVTRARVIDFECPEPIDLMIDGEVVTHAPRRIEVLPSAIDVRV